jgi:hypothetical protein
MLEVSPPIILFVKMLKFSNIYIYNFERIFFFVKGNSKYLEYSIFDIEFPILVFFFLRTFVEIVLALW